MALTIAPVAGADSIFGNKRVKVRDCTIATSYASGGETITPAQVGLKVIQQAVVHGLARAAGGATAVAANYNHSTGKLQLYETAAAVDLAFDEADNTPSLVGFVVRVTFIGY